MNNKELEYLGFKNVKKEDKKVFIALSADYGNIGDIGITFAQIDILQNIFKDRKIIEIPMFNTYECEQKVKEILNDDDICTIIGGGNFGNIYLSCEEKRRFIIEIFKNNKIITFPQSIYFSNTDDGIQELQKSINIYGNHKNLTILAREQTSYNIIKENFKNPVQLVPDIVFYLKENYKYFKPSNRENISICFRNDEEKSIDTDTTSKLQQLLKDNNIDNLKLISTHLGNTSVLPSKRLEIFKNCLNNFTNSKVVITDRLHGLIFSVITNTPCIAFDNSNKKISSTYNTWLKDIPLVKLMDKYDEEKILEYVKEFSNIKNPHIQLNDKINFDTIINLLKQ